MLVGARRLAAAAIHGTASRCSGLALPRDGHRPIARFPFYLPLRAACSDSAGHVHTTNADTTSPPTDTPRDPFPSLLITSALRDVPAATGAPCSQSAGREDLDTTSSRQQAPAPPRNPLSSRFVMGILRDRQRVSIEGLAASAVRYSSTSAGSGGVGKETASRQEGPPRAVAPRQSLSSIFTRRRGSTSAAPVPPPPPTGQHFPKPAPPPVTVPATVPGQQSATGPSSSLSSLFAGRPMPPPFRPPCPYSPLPFLNEACPSSEVLLPLPRNSYPDLFTVEEIFDPFKFVKKFPLMVHVHPKFAKDSKYDRWMFTEIAKELARSLPSTITQAHAKGKSFEKFSAKDLLVAANLSDPDDISARFMIRVATKTATPESMEQDLQNSASALEELMEFSVGSPDFWGSLAKDIEAFLNDLKHPLSASKRYLTVNHWCLFPLAVMSQAYITCFELLFRGRLPEAKLALILKQLPYSDGEWKVIAIDNALLEKMLTDHRLYVGLSQALQAEYRRNAVSHKTVFGDDHPPAAVDIILQLYFPMFMVELLRVLFENNILLPLRLHRLFRR